MRVIFRENGDTFDMVIDGRAGEYDLRPEEFDEALRRRRVPADAEVFYEEHGRLMNHQRRR